MEIDLPKNIEKHLLKNAKILAIDPNNLVVEALRNFFEDMEDYHDGIAGYQNYIASGRKGIRASDLREELGLNDA